MFCKTHHWNTSGRLWLFRRKGPGTSQHKLRELAGKPTNQGTIPSFTRPQAPPCVWGTLASLLGSSTGTTMHLIIKGFCNDSVTTYIFVFCFSFGSLPPGSAQGQYQAQGLESLTPWVLRGPCIPCQGIKPWFPECKEHLLPRLAIFLAPCILWIDYDIGSSELY